MKYSDLTLDNPSRLRRYTHERRFRMACRLLNPQAEDHILDFGAGDGELILRLAHQCPQAALHGFEPSAGFCVQAREKFKLGGVRVQLYEQSRSLATSDFDKISCLEVMEHLPDAQRHAALAEIRRCLALDGKFLLSVPIEIGPPALAKYLVRRQTDRHARRLSWRELWYSLLGNSSQLKREQADQYIVSHFGFDFRNLAREIEHAGFRRIARQFSPFLWGGWLLNSQIFDTYVLNR